MIAVDSSALLAILRRESEADRLLHAIASAALNLGDCAAYALARTAQVALLFKGDDFSQTDLIAA